MGGGKKGGKGGGKKGAKGAKGGKGGMAKRRGMMPMAGADGVGMTPRGMRNRRTRLNAERRMEDRARHAEAEAQEKKKEEAAKDAKRKAAAMGGGQKTSSMMSLAKKSHSS